MQVLARRWAWEHSWARPDQMPPPSPGWLLLAGRGAGKTRAAAETVAWWAITRPGTRWAVVGATSSDARDVMIEGVSGLLPILHAYGQVDRWNRSLGELRLTNGSRIRAYSAEEPDRLRGPQHHGAWADEIAAWDRPETLDQLLLGLRLGDDPPLVISTTPRPSPLMRALIADESMTITRASTYDNRANLSAAALARLEDKYGGTRLGRQELLGELLDDTEGALFTRDNLDTYRVRETPTDLVRVVVAIDPAVSSGPDSDETGIVVAAGDDHGHVYVLADYTIRGTPREWAEAAVAAYHRHKADRIVCEVNQGGDLVVSNLRTVDPGKRIPIERVHATRGKALRAQPVASLAEQGRLHLVGSMPDLEDQMTEWLPGDPSPDRLDAMVYAVTSVALGRPTPRPVQVFRYR
jgi:phage terminase large subunit-like protein